MWQPLKLFCVVLPVFLLLDAIWIGVVMKTFYDREIGDLARRVDGGMAPRWGAAVLVYLLIPTGIVLFVKPLLQPGGTSIEAFRWGATFGLVLYGVYDLTNRAILQNWTLTMTIVDIAWGCVICGFVSTVMQAANAKVAV